MPKRGTTAKGASEQRRSFSSRRGGKAAPRSGSSDPLEVSTSRRQLPDDPGRPSESRSSRRAPALRGHGRHATGRPARARAARRRLARRKPSHPNHQAIAPRATPGEGSLEAARAVKRDLARDETVKAVPARVKSTGMRDRAVCSRISSICRSAKSRPVKILARISRAPDSVSSSVGPPWSVVDGRSGSRRERREQEVVPAWKRGSSASSHRADESPRLPAGLPLAGHVPRRNPSARVTATRSSVRHARPASAKVGRASRVIGESISMTRLEPSSRAARSEAARSRIR